MHVRVQDTNDDFDTNYTAAYDCTYNVSANYSLTSHRGGTALQPPDSASLSPEPSKYHDVYNDYDDDVQTRTNNGCIDVTGLLEVPGTRVGV